jgi:hypothetical protein
MESSKPQQPWVTGNSYASRSRGLTSCIVLPVKTIDTRVIAGPQCRCGFHKRDVTRFFVPNRAYNSKPEINGNNMGRGAGTAASSTGHSGTITRPVLQMAYY